jgi:hypothetical protein
MDLSFAQRLRNQKNGLQASTTLARLLAELSARQAVSPTALAQMQAAPVEDSETAGHPDIAQFAPGSARKAAASRAASFNTEIAETILTQSKSS